MRDRVLLLLTAGLMGWIAWRLDAGQAADSLTMAPWAPALAAGMGALAGLAGSVAEKKVQCSFSILFAAGLLVGPVAVADHYGAPMPWALEAGLPAEGPQARPEPKAARPFQVVDETAESLGLLILASGLGLTAGLAPKSSKRKPSSA
jgi:hypothetical protein